MLNIKLIRLQPDMVKEKISKRGDDTTVVDTILELDKKRRTIWVKVEDLKALRNKKSE